MGTKGIRKKNRSRRYTSRGEILKIKKAQNQPRKCMRIGDFILFIFKQLSMSLSISII